MNMLKTLASSNPMIYKTFMKYKGNGVVDYFPNENTNLFIAAYPRSGNDFGKQLAKNFFPGIKISSHFHRAGAFKYALKIEVPVIGIIRDPMECVSSSMVKYRKERNLKNLPTYPMFDYLAFHREMLKYVEQMSILSFDTLISDPMIYIEKLEKSLGIEYDKSLSLEVVIGKIDKKLNGRELDCNQVTDIKKGPDPFKENLKEEAKQLINRNEKFKEKAFELYSSLQKYL